MVGSLNKLKVVKMGIHSLVVIGHNVVISHTFVDLFTSQNYQEIFSIDSKTSQLDF